MQTHNLKRNTQNRKAKQVGRGGKRGKTSGRGTKGQNARSGRKKRPEMRDFIKKIPKLRGRGKNLLKSRLADFITVNLKTIEAVFDKNEVVSPKSLVEKGLVSLRNGKIGKVKILGNEGLTKGLSFEKVIFSAGAKKAIKLAGGKIVESKK